jgi:branched-chain amino acid transport system substrate-binding protein
MGIMIQPVPALLLAAAIAFLPGPARGAGPVRIGMVLTPGGPRTSTAEVERNSLLMAVEEVNRGGGVAGRDLMVEVAESGGSARGARAAVERLSSAKVGLVAGVLPSSEGREAAAAAEAMRVPYLSAGGAADDITRRGYRYVFRITPAASLYLDGVTDLLTRMVRPRTAAILRGSGAADRASVLALGETAAAAGWSVVMEEELPDAEADRSALLSRLRDAAPDVLFLAGAAPRAAALLAAARAGGAGLRAVVGAGPAFAGSGFARAAEGTAEGVLVPAAWTPDEVYSGARRYAEDYRSRFGTEADERGASVHAAVITAADALRRSSSFAPDDVRAALAACDLMTACGRVRFDSFAGYTNQNRPTSLVLQWLGGRVATVWPAESATRKLITPAAPPRTRP